MRIDEVMNRRDFLSGLGATAATLSPGKLGGDDSVKSPSPETSPEPMRAPQRSPLAPKEAPRPPKKLPERIIRAVIYQESRGNPNSVNKKTGAAGLMQIMPATWKKPGYGLEPGPAGKIMHPEYNLKFGIKLLNAYYRRFDHDLIKALAAYNWGPSNVLRWDGDLNNLPDETKNYVVEVVHRAKGQLPTYEGDLL